MGKYPAYSTCTRIVERSGFLVSKFSAMLPAFVRRAASLSRKLIDIGSDELDFSHRTLERHGCIHGLVPPVTVILKIDLLLRDIGIFYGLRHRCNSRPQEH